MIEPTYPIEGTHNGKPLRAYEDCRVTLEENGRELDISPPLWMRECLGEINDWGYMAGRLVLRCQKGTALSGNIRGDWVFASDWGFLDTENRVKAYQQTKET